MTLPQPTAFNGLMHGDHVHVVEESLLRRRPFVRVGGALTPAMSVAHGINSNTVVQL